MLPAPKDRDGLWWPDWWAIHDAVQRGVFTLSPEETWIVDAFLHGYRPTQIREWFSTHRLYQKTLNALRRRWRPMEESVSQLQFPPWGGQDETPADLYANIEDFTK